MPHLMVYNTPAVYTLYALIVSTYSVDLFSILTFTPHHTIGFLLSEKKEENYFYGYKSLAQYMQYHTAQSYQQIFIQQKHQFHFYWITLHILVLSVHYFYPTISRAYTLL